MNDSYVISKMNEFMHQLSGNIADWLGDKLPKLTECWWEELVISNLSIIAKRTGSSAWD